MKVYISHATDYVRVDIVPEPGILDPRDIIVNSILPTMAQGDVIVHEPMGVAGETNGLAEASGAEDIQQIYDPLV